MNLILNPTFESNDDNWYLEADYVRSNADAHGGNWSVKQDSASVWANLLSNQMTVSTSTLYKVEFWYKVTVNSGYAPKLQMNTSGSGYSDNVHEADLSNTSGVWTKYSQTFTTHATNTDLWLRIFNNNGDVDAFYDDFLVESVAGNLKSVNGVAFADIKSKNSVAIANIKSINGVTTS